MASLLGHDGRDQLARCRIFIYILICSEVSTLQYSFYAKALERVLFENVCRPTDTRAYKLSVRACAS